MKLFFTIVLAILAANEITAFVNKLAQEQVRYEMCNDKTSLWYRNPYFCKV